MFNLVIGFLNDFLIIAGGMITTAMLAQDVVAVPRLAVILLSVLTGLVQAGRRLQAKLDPSPAKPDAVLVRSEAQLMAQIHEREAATTQLVDSITRAMNKVPPEVTPLRVDPPASQPQPAPVPKQDFS